MSARSGPLAPQIPWRPLLVVSVFAGVAGVLVGQLALKGLVVAAGLACLGLGMIATRQRALLVLVLMLGTVQFMLHKSFGPISLISSGAEAIYLTSLDFWLLVLYTLWFLEGRLVPDLKFALRDGALLLPLLAGLGVLLSLFIAQDLNRALAEIVRMAWMFLLFLYVAVRVRSKGELGFALVSLLMVVVVQFVIVMLQWKLHRSLSLTFLGGDQQLQVRNLDQGTVLRPAGTVYHPDFLAALVGPLGLVGLSLAISLRSGWALRLALLATPAMAVAMMVIAQTRAALVGFAVALVVLICLELGRRRLSWKPVAASLAAAGVALIWQWPRFQTVVLNNLGTDHFNKEVQSRVQLNDLALRMIEGNPLTGVGLNNFQAVMNHYDTYGLIFFGNPVHDIYLLVLSETGIFGLLGFLATSLLLINQALRLTRQQDLMLSGLGAGVLVAYLFFAVEELLTFSLREDMPLAAAWILAGLVYAGLRLAVVHREGLNAAA